APELTQGLPDGPSELRQALRTDDEERHEEDDDELRGTDVEHGSLVERFYRRPLGSGPVIAWPFSASRRVRSWARAASCWSDSSVGRTSLPKSETARPSRFTCRNSPITTARRPTAPVTPTASQTICGAVTPLRI